MLKSCNICRSKKKLTLIEDKDLIVLKDGQYCCKECYKELTREEE